MRSAGQSRPTVLHYCQHSVGLGHLVRSLSIAGALAARFRVVILSGGLVPDGITIPEGVELIALPAVGAGADGELVSLTPGLSLEEAWARRRSILLSQMQRLRPCAIIVELFPLGRRKFAGELVPLLEAARRDFPAASVICSVRDILVAGGPAQQHRDDEAAERLNRYFDAVVVHGDPRLVRLEDTFRPSVEVVPPVHYSGYVVPAGEIPASPRPNPPVVVASAGGGMVGGPLLRTVAEAHRLFFEPRGIATRIITGPFLPPADRAAIQAEADRCQGLTVERFVPDLCATMARASVSVSQCGYNTALDLLRARVPALVVPDDRGRETEQMERARRLAALGALEVLPSGELSTKRLAEAVFGLLSAAPPVTTLDLDGAAKTAAIIEALAGRPARNEAKAS